MPNVCNNNNENMNRSKDDVERSLLDSATRNKLIKRHSVAALCKLDAKHAALEVQITNGLFHPLEPNAVPFVLNDLYDKKSLLHG